MRALAFLLFVLAVTPAQAETRRYAVVAAWNRAQDPTLEPLEFADDDAARYAELLDVVADVVEVHAVLDPTTQRLHPEIARRARPPVRAELMRSIDRAFGMMAADRAAGREAIFYLVLVGHGEIGPGGEGQVMLVDGPLTRAQLFRDIVARSPATVNHVIVDACNSYFLVKRRGGSSDDGAPPETASAAAFVAGADLSRYPTTGVLVSTSGAKESHEWGALAAGVFSHEIRSALTGAADADGDGRVGYDEVRAFVAAANLRVADARARVDLYASAPAIDGKRPLVDLAATRFPAYLTVPAGAPLHVYLEDDRGVRYADLHVAGESAVHVGLLGRPYYFARSPDQKKERRLVTSDKRMSLVVAALGVSEVSRARGAIDEALRKNLFAEAYGPTFYRGFAAAHGLAALVDRPTRWTPDGEVAPASLVPIDTPPSRGGGKKIAGWTLVTGGVLALGVGAWAWQRAASAEDEFDRHVLPSGDIVDLSPAEAAELESRARRFAITRDVLLVAGGLALTSGVVVLLWPSRREPVRAQVGVSPRGVFVRGSF